jgi:propionate CoA-transferase
VIFCGTFTSGGLEVAIRDGNLAIVREGEHRKFVEHVEQITFSGDYAREMGRTVLYVTERAVFNLEGGEMVLAEIAPGIDIDRHILPFMDFKPVISPSLKTMDRRLFADSIMGLKHDMENCPA